VGAGLPAKRPELTSQIEMFAGRSGVDFGRTVKYDER
jgi:hypothetical protein